MFHLTAVAVPQPKWIKITHPEYAVDIIYPIQADNVYVKHAFISGCELQLSFLIKFPDDILQVAGEFEYIIPILHQVVC